MNIINLLAINKIMMKDSCNEIIYASEIETKCDECNLFAVRD